MAYFDHDQLADIRTHIGWLLKKMMTIGLTENDLAASLNASADKIDNWKRARKTSAPTETEDEMEKLFSNIIKELYTDRLMRKKDTLGFKMKDIAKAIGVDDSTMSRYMNGLNQKLPSEKERSLINEYIYNKEHYKDYDRQPNECFGDLLKEMLGELELDQQWLAEEIGKDQRTVSNYVKGKLPSDAQKQYEILMCLYKEAENKYKAGELTFGNAYEELKELIFGAEELSDHDIEIMNDIIGNPDYYDYDRYEYPQKLMDCYDSLPERLQAQIIRHFRAFFEQTKDQIENGVTAMIATYNERVRLMEDFRCMTDDGRCKFVYMLEQNSVMTYPEPDDEEETSYFAAVADMRTIVTEKGYFKALGETGDTKHRSRESKKRGLFECLVEKYEVWDNAVDELKFKLGFSSYEWYVWSLLLIARHNDTDINMEEFFECLEDDFEEP